MFEWLGKYAVLQDQASELTIQAHPLTPARWNDLLTVFGPQGAYSGCWCMYWRIGRKEFAANGNSGNRDALCRIVTNRTVPGLLYYVGETPIAWCSVAPRGDYASLARSPLLRAVDDRDVWSIVCFYVVRSYRHRGIFAELVRQAVGYARSAGAVAVEAYPDLSAQTGAAAFMGIDAVYRKLGFREIAKRKPHRPILRYEVGP